MPNKNNRSSDKKKGQKQKNVKTAFNNQWVSTGLNQQDKRERRDGPGGDNGNKGT